jgi:hypothetical protein
LLFDANAVVDELAGYEGHVINEFFIGAPGACNFVSTELPE